MTEKSNLVKYLEEQIEGWELFLIEKKKEVEDSSCLYSSS